MVSTYESTSHDLLALQSSRGSAAALARLGRLQARDPAVAGVCHAVAHDLGHAAYAAGNRDAATALADRDDVCGGGFTHGVIETALGESENPARDLLLICAPAQDGSCFHGVGHGLMFATGMDVERSLRMCDRAPESILSTRCGEGVFMQLFSADVAGGHTGHAAESPTASTALATCAATRARYAANCWFYAPTTYLADHPDDFDGAIGWCRGAGEPNGRSMCARGVGSRTVKYHPDDPTIGAGVCGRAGGLRDACLGGMGSYWSVHHEGARPPSDVCARLGDVALERRCLAVT